MTCFAICLVFMWKSHVSKETVSVTGWFCIYVCLTQSKGMCGAHFAEEERMVQRDGGNFVVWRHVSASTPIHVLWSQPNVYLRPKRYMCIYAVTDWSQLDNSTMVQSGSFSRVRNLHSWLTQSRGWTWNGSWVYSCNTQYREDLVECVVLGHWMLFIFAHHIPSSTRILPLFL